MAKLAKSHSNYKTAKTGIKSGCANSLNKDKQSPSSKIHTCISVIKLQWLDDMRFKDLFNSISVISGRWKNDDKKLCEGNSVNG